MAKEDFCFTYYDGDAARDMAHMNRLERGAYGDLVVSQRKFGRLSIGLIKKTLGNDFNAVWEALEVILKVEDEKYFIEWLDTSIEKMRKQSAHQTANGKLGGRPKKPKENPEETQIQTQTDVEKKPLEDGDGILNTPVDKKEEENDFSEKTKNVIVPEIFNTWKRLNPSYIGSLAEDYHSCLEIAYNIAEYKNWKKSAVVDSKEKECLKSWEKIAAFIMKDGFWNKRTLTVIAKKSNWQSIVNGMRASIPTTAPKAEQGTYTDQQRFEFENFLEWIDLEAPRVAGMQEPFTIDQFLSEDFYNYSIEIRKTILKSMNNHAKLYDKYVSAYETFTTWLKRTDK